MKRIFKAGFIVLFFIILIILQYYLILKEPGTEEVDIDYQVEISTNNSAYQVILPIPSEYDSEENFGKGEIIETPYGKGLFIESSENLSLKANFNIKGHEMWNPIEFMKYNLTCRSEWWSYWIYYNGSNGTYLDLFYDEFSNNPYVVGRYIIHINYSLQEGWNTYNDTSTPISHGDKFGWAFEDAKKETCCFSIGLTICCIMTIGIYIANDNKMKNEDMKKNEQEEDIGRITPTTLVVKKKK